MILVTGAGGKTGRAVLAALHARGASTRALLRSAAEMTANEAMAGDLSNSSTIAAALQGVQAVYFIAPNVYPDEASLGAAWIAAAKAAGVRTFVYHSVLYPQVEAMPHHWQKLRVEEALIQSGLSFTVLQPASYMQNILPYLEDIRMHGEYSVPYSPHVLFTPVDLHDMAAVAARVLLEPDHSGAIYPLAGPEALSSVQMAAQVAEHIQRSVAAVQQPLSEWLSANQHLPTYARDTLAAMFAWYDQHGFAASAHTLTSLLGRQPTRFASFLQRELK